MTGVAGVVVLRSAIPTRTTLAAVDEIVLEYFTRSVSPPTGVGVSRRTLRAM